MILNKKPCPDYLDEYKSDYMFLDTETRLLLKIDDERLSLSKTNQLLVNQTLHINCEEPDVSEQNAVLTVQSIAEEWYIDEEEKLTVFDKETGSPKNISGWELKLNNGTLDTYTITNDFDVTCEFDITEICHKWSKGIVQNNGLFVFISGELPSAGIGDCYLTRRYIVVDAYDPDFTYHSIDMGNAGQVLINDLTNTITVQRNEMSFPVGKMPINLYRYFDFSKTYPLSNPAGIGSHWNYECSLINETSYVTAWHSFDGSIIRFTPSSSDINLWENNERGEKYKLFTNGANMLGNSYNGVTIESPDNLRYTFGPKGKLVRIDDMNNSGSYIIVEYNGISTPNSSSPQDYITTIKNESGCKFNFTYETKPYDYNGTTVYKKSLSSIEYQDSQNNTVEIDNTETKLLYDYIMLPNQTLALTKVTYPSSEQNTELYVEYLYDADGRLKSIIDTDKRKLEIDYTLQIDDNTVLDHYPSAFSFNEYVFNKAYTDNPSINEQYISVPKSSLEIDRFNTYQRTFENESEEHETLHYTKQFNLLYYTNDAENDYYADYKSANGKSYISQIVSPEKDPEVNVNNPGFEPNQGSSSIPFWSGIGLESVQGNLNGQGQQFARINGSINDIRYAAQKATINGKAGDIFVIGGNARADSAVPNETQSFGIEIYKVVRASNGRESIGEMIYSLNFDPTMDNEVQFRLGAFKLSEDIQKVYYKIVYSYQTGYADFDNVLLYKSTENVDFFDAPVVDDEDEDAFYISTPSTSSNTNDNIQVDVLSDGTNQMISKYEYSSTANSLIKHTDHNNVITNYDYDDNTGLLTGKSVSINDTQESLIDNYSYDAMGMLKEVTRVVDSLDNTTGASYTYEHGKISSVEHNNMKYDFNYDSYGNLEDIVMVVDENDEFSDISVISYDYTDDTYHNINKITYSNGYVLEYVYGENGKITSIYERSTPSSAQNILYSYSYDEDGELVEIKDHCIRRVVTYSGNSVNVYELATNSDNIEDAELMYSKGPSSDTPNKEDFKVFSMEYSVQTNAPTYDNNQKTTTYSSTINNINDYPTTFESRAVCDYFGRTKSSSISHTLSNSSVDTHSVVNESIYWNNTSDNSTTNLLKTYTSTVSNENSNSDIELNKFTSEYEYDFGGRITHVYYKQNNDERELVYYYEYDKAGQLIKEADFLEACYTEYTYNNHGNVTRKKVYSGENSFVYRYGTVSAASGATPEIIEIEYNSIFGDVLERYDGDFISHDVYGNPLSYHGNNYGTPTTYDLTWEGNILRSANPQNDDSFYEYKYDDEGRRTQKIFYSDYNPDSPETSTTEIIMDYIWDGNKLVGYRIRFGSLGVPVTIEAVILYDELDNPIGLRYCMNGLTDDENNTDLANEDIFWFVKDGQGNIKAVYSENTNYTIGCQYTPGGDLTVSVSDSFKNELNQKIANADDSKKAILIALSYVISIQYTSMLSIDASQSAYNSYIMDTETGLYYCQGRYYSPEYGRFINVDNFERVAYDLENPFNANPFVYYNNDPINCKGVYLNSKSSSKVVGIQAEFSKSLFSFADSVGIEFVYDSVKDELYAYYYRDANSNVDYTARAIEQAKNILGNIPFNSSVSLKGLASNFKINNSLSLSFFRVQNDKNFAWPSSYLGTSRIVPNQTNNFRGYTAYGNNYKAKGVCFYPTSNIGFTFNNMSVKYTKLEVDFPELKNYLSMNKDSIIEVAK